MNERLLLRNLLFTTPATLAYLVLAPLAALALDRRLGLVWPLPGWSRFAGPALILAGLIPALWSVWVFATLGAGTPNPLKPPRHLVVAGPYRFSRNPMMLGGWVAGFGLAVVLGSVSLVAAYGVIVAAGCLYVRYIEEPRLRARFGTVYTEYAARVPRWWGCGLGEACGPSHHPQDG